MGCSTDTEESADGPITTTTWLGCPEGIVLKLEVIAGGSHAWPGGTGGFLGTPTTALDATQEVWDFFESLEGQAG
jgi:poly(3-hydroxybutyrate) depolymerase